MSTGGGTLQLTYAFDSEPIRASVGGAKPNTVTLRVIISNPNAALGEKVTLEGILIQIPVGAELGGDLSAAPDLPQPVPTSIGAWTLSSTGSTVEILPTSGEGTTADITDTLIFTLPNITINEEVGSVQVGVNETDQNGNQTPPNDADGNPVFSPVQPPLVKRKPDFPVTGFTATPDVLTDLDQSVTLNWTCSDQGQNYVYRVYSVDPGSHVQPGPNSWVSPEGALEPNGECYTCADGSPEGVQTPPLEPGSNTMLMTFRLDVIQPDPDGHRMIHDTLETTVPVEIPTFIRASFNQSPSGFFVQLHWQAINAGKCTVDVDNIRYDDNAPTDTYEHGYTMVFTDPPGTQHHIYVKAWPKTGTAEPDFRDFGIEINGEIITLNLPSTATGLAVTPDGTLALAALWEGGVAVIDLGQQPAVEPAVIATGALQSGLAIANTSGGLLALASAGDSVVVIDIARRQAEADSIYVGNSPTFIAVTPDGALAFVGINGGVAVIDVPTRTARAEIIPIDNLTLLYQGSIVITPDGAQVLVADQNTGVVYVIDVATLTLKPNPIAGFLFPFAIAVMPDSKHALVAGAAQPSIVDIEDGTVQSTTIGDGDNTVSAIAPDGHFALITGNLGFIPLTAIDFLSNPNVSNDLPIPNSPMLNCVALAFSRDYAHVLVSVFWENRQPSNELLLL
ncbi:MAG TPA: YncE family protein [Blastocatellia bacterium]|nr:YncE family protein [Blastocatellia bacterium]